MSTWTRPLFSSTASIVLHSIMSWRACCNVLELLPVMTKLWKVLMAGISFDILFNHSLSLSFSFHCLDSSLYVVWNCSRFSLLEVHSRNCVDAQLLFMGVSVCSSYNLYPIFPQRQWLNNRHFFIRNHYIKRPHRQHTSLCGSSVI